MARPILGGVRSSSSGAPISKELKDHIDGQARQASKDLAAARAALSGVAMPVFIEFPDNKAYLVGLAFPIEFTIDTVSSFCTTGTCTATVSINGVNLGGSPNSVSTSFQARTHTTNNAVTSGTSVTVTISSNSGAENVSLMISGTRTF